MAVAKTVEIISSSTQSIEAAVRDGIAKAAETINGMKAPGSKGPRPSSVTTKSPNGE